MTKAYRDLEILVAKIQRDLAPKSIVEHDVRLKGHSTGRLRQIDVLVRDNIGQFEVLIIFDCKDYKTPADVKAVEEFYGLLDDVRAHKGVIVCPRGFTKSAKLRAQSLQIDLYSPVDTDPHKWTVRATAPALCDYRSASISFRLSIAASGPFKVPNDFLTSLQVFDANDQALGTTVLRPVFQLYGLVGWAAPAH